MKCLFNLKKYFVTAVWIIALAFSASVFSEELSRGLYLDRTQLVSEQINLLKNRFHQAQNELTKLKQDSKTDRSLLSDKTNKQLSAEVQLEIAVSQSNLDSLEIEVSESDQTVRRLEKSSQEIEKQLNLVNVFGFKMIHLSQHDVKRLTEELHYQHRLLELEKERADYLRQLMSTATNTLQFYQKKQDHLQLLLKSQTMTLLKEQHARTELAFQKQQDDWLKKLNSLNNQLNQLVQSNSTNTALYAQLAADIFYVNENVNFSYLQMLIARHQDQIDQLKTAVTRGGSIGLLNKMIEQAQLLSKQLASVEDLLNTRKSILDKRKTFLQLTKKNEQSTDESQLKKLSDQYQAAETSVAVSNQELILLRSSLEKTLQHELSARQGLPGWDMKSWLDLGSDILLLPNLIYHLLKSIATHLVQTVMAFSYLGWVLLFGLELLFLIVYLYLNQFLKKVVSGLADHESGHINLKWLIIKLWHRTLLDLVVMFNIGVLCYLSRLPMQSFLFVIHLAWVWLFFKVMVLLARLYLVETVHDRAGIDVRLYHRLKWTFIVGGVITACAVFVRTMPVSYEVTDFFARLFLLFLFVISFFLLKSWDVLPGLITPHIDPRRTFLIRVIRLLGFALPLVLIVNSLVGLVGYVNLVYTICWYEGVFLLVLIAYLILRGLLVDAMEFLSTLLIRHVPNGWFWTEAFLKPLSKVLRVILFFMVWVLLFLVYAWDKQLTGLDRLDSFIHYRLGTFLNTVVTPLSMIELIVIISLLYWAAKWIREFVYRFLLSRTQDMGVRNSIAVLSQYAMIVVGVLVGLRVLGIDFFALTAVATAFAVGIGFGLRDMANNFVCGFLLLFERPLKVGDVVTVNGYEGDVIHMGGRAITIRTWDHIEVVVPNSEIFSKTFMNWTAKDNIVRAITSVKIDQLDDPLQVQQLIHEVLALNVHVLKDPAPEVFVNQLTDGLIEFEIRFYVNLRLIKSRISIRSEVLIAIWEAFDQHGIQPPYPQREIYVKGSQSPPPALE